MMPKGKHPYEALDDETIRRLEKPGRYADGNCLYLVVDPSGAKHWVLRIMVLGRRRDMGLGSLKIVTLARARQRAKKYRLEARSGGDPLANRRAHKGFELVTHLVGGAEIVETLQDLIDDGRI